MSARTTAAELPPLDRTAPRAVVNRLSQLPWWLLFILLAGVFLLYKITTDELYSVILGRLLNGLGVTIGVTVVAYFAAIAIGLVAGLGRVSKNPVIFNLATLYVQIIRGVPILVQIIYVSFVIVPALFTLAHNLGAALTPVLGAQNFLAQANPQNVDFIFKVTFALAIAYGGFEAETFRAGIESIGRGQMEAGRSLGMSYVQTMRYIVLPQAIRRILPPLGNDFIAMLKDSSLVSVMGVRDVTQQARLYAAASFRYPETYNTLAFVYLSMTILLSLGVKWVENRWGQYGRAG
jgi:polar amino acid transport system permease protein